MKTLYMRNTSTCSLCRKGRLLFEGLLENEYLVGKTHFKDKKEMTGFRRKLQFSFEDFVDKEGSAAAAAGKGHEEDEENDCPPRQRKSTLFLHRSRSSNSEPRLRLNGSVANFVAALAT